MTWTSSYLHEARSFARSIYSRLSAKLCSWFSS